MYQLEGKKARVITVHYKVCHSAKEPIIKPHLVVKWEESRYKMRCTDISDGRGSNGKRANQ